MGRGWLSVVAVVVLLAGCSGGSDVAQDPSVTSPPVSSSAPDQAPVTSTAPDEPTATESPVPETEPAASPMLAGLPLIELLTPSSGGGVRPLLQWSPTGAPIYGVYIYAPGGSLYWAWRGRETEVFVGGAIRIEPEHPGPSITEGMTWAVVAYDENLLPLASSAVVPIGP